MAETANIRKPASDGKKSAIGQERHAIYKSVWQQINHAKKARCWLEVITLAESVIADRLEARIAHINGQHEDARKARTAAQSAQKLLRIEDAKDDDIPAIYDEVSTWSKRRNMALHAMAKLFETTTNKWNERYQHAEQAAKDGENLARRVSALVRRLNTSSQPIR